MELRQKSVSTQVFRSMLESAERQGLDPEEVCRRCGLDPSDLAAERISGDRHVLATQLLADLPGEIAMPPGGIAGVLAGFPEFAGVVCNSRTLRDALRGFLEYRELIGNVDWLLAEETDDAIAFDYVLEGPPQRAAAAFFNFGMLAQLARLYDPATSVREAMFCGPSRVSAAHRREMLSANVRFEQSCNRMVLASSALDRPFEWYNPTLATIQHDSAAKMRARLRVRESFASACMALLGDWLREAREERPAAEMQQRLCRRFDISRWTLQRRLRGERTSFHELLMRARMGEARALLERTRLSVGEIASRVGYTSLSAFSHSFARECGNAPSAYRDLHATAGSRDDVTRSPRGR